MLLLPDGDKGTAGMEVEWVQVSQWAPPCHQPLQLSSQLQDSQLFWDVESFRGHFLQVHLRMTLEKQATLEAGRYCAVWQLAAMRGERLDCVQFGHRITEMCQRTSHFFLHHHFNLSRHLKISTILSNVTHLWSPRGSTIHFTALSSFLYLFMALLLCSGISFSTFN